MRLHHFLTVLALGVALGIPASATPPRYTSVHDNPVGISKTHLFLFRTLGDNEGSYFINTSRRYLVAQNIKTGKVDNIWFLDETRETSGEPGEETFLYRRVTPKIDPLDIMERFGAKPVLIDDPSDYTTGKLAASNTVELVEGGIQDNSNEPAQILVPAEIVRARITASMNPFMAYLPDDTSPVDPMVFDEDAYTKDLFDCFVAGLFGNVPDADIYRIQCENGDFSVLGYTLYLTVPRNR
jgi:hypothetical protein